MIHKLVQIQNIGRFIDFSTKNQKWNGIFEKNNIIYADNGSGKTTLAQIFKSMTGDDTLLTKRKSFGSSNEIEVLFVSDKNEPIRYHANKWNRTSDNIEVFDAYFTESNIYIITLGNYDQKGSLFQIIVGDKAVDLWDKIRDLREERRKANNRRRNNRRLSKQTQDQEKRQIYLNRTQNNIKTIEKLNKEILLNEERLIKMAEEFGSAYLDKINHFLTLLCPNIQITKLNQKGKDFIYYMRVLDFDVRSDSEHIPLKHILSEGDKNALALSFFFARLSIKPDLNNRIIIFDDPISSFDHHRRNVTINLLNNFAKQSLQFFLLSHDIYFARDFTEAIENRCKNLRITRNGATSSIIEHDIKQETLTGIFRDLLVIKDFADHEEDSKYNIHDVIRCIRPTLESIFRIKYYCHIKDDEWLGDMISHIRNADDTSVFHHLKPLIDELSELNNYSKKYHHSRHSHDTINTKELKSYCTRTIQILQKI